MGCNHNRNPERKEFKEKQLTSSQGYNPEKSLKMNLNGMLIMKELM